jgi:hypothetical protein
LISHVNSAIEWLSKRSNWKAFAIPAVENVISSMWDRFGKPRVIHSSATSALVTCLTTILLGMYSTTTHYLRRLSGRVTIMSCVCSHRGVQTQTHQRDPFPAVRIVRLWHSRWSDGVPLHSGRDSRGGFWT